MVLKINFSFGRSAAAKEGANTTGGSINLKEPQSRYSAHQPANSQCRSHSQRKNQEEDERERRDTEKTDGNESDDENVHGGLIEISLTAEERHSHTQAPCDVETIEELIEYAKEGDLRSLMRICEGMRKRNISADSPGYMGWTAAHWAAREGHLHILEYLLHQHVNLDSLDKKGDCLLHKAAANGQFRICQWLLQHGFNVQAKNNHGLTPLDVARIHLANTRSSEAALCEAILSRENANTF